MTASSRTTVGAAVPGASGEAKDALPYDPGRYFTGVSDSTALPLAVLVRSRARPEGIENARRYMVEAYEGTRGKRAPIAVQPLEDGRFLVTDGNSTLTVAILAGWPDVPCRVTSVRESEAPT